MTVEELIEQLKKCDPKHKVFIEFYDKDEGWVTTYIKRVLRDHNNTSTIIEAQE